jgi:hypothetical protein
MAWYYTEDVWSRSTFAVQRTILEKTWESILPLRLSRPQQLG